MKPIVADTDDRRWQAVCERDTRADGQFVFAVLTTGICCRPSCRSRRARRENVRFFADVAAAVAAGFRPCKRCQPDKDYPQQQRVDKVAQACRLLEQDAPLTLEALAGQLAMSPFHFHRLFKSVTGMTPKAWQQAWRAQRLREALEQGIPVTQSERGVCAVLPGDNDAALLDELRRRFPNAELREGDPDFCQQMAEIFAHLDDSRRPVSLPLDLQGTAFQLQVWQALRQIPAGETRSYRQVAEHIGQPRAVRAVAGACAANSLAVIVPCHRVVREDGALSGYRWGTARKAQLLAREAQHEEE
ncbi:TPA: methylated-DNA--[protein]-cysteine S-methyltransferase [Klebsiella pneumoniae subsp. pneumoniae]|nr:methylated-DNA--[protein]-cysteine S-methyltransferase [Klebsiella pneumoniae subsp. pneumoniae]HBQ5984869.1 methylated-DNA--[protein]-cysteine S-methyltransferase [Klebsiella pneumoniae subsp. pneumoniae]HEE5213181.1 methylated-DNA--[protein]-cysteine S-methyltransferase [Klebsiella pneumoniae]